MISTPKGRICQALWSSWSKQWLRVETKKYGWTERSWLPTNIPKPLVAEYVETEMMRSSPLHRRPQCSEHIPPGFQSSQNSWLWWLWLIDDCDDCHGKDGDQDVKMMGKQDLPVVRMDEDNSLVFLIRSLQEWNNSPNQVLCLKPARTLNQWTQPTLQVGHVVQHLERSVTLQHSPRILTVQWNDGDYFILW